MMLPSPMHALSFSLYFLTCGLARGDAGKGEGQSPHLQHLNIPMYPVVLLLKMGYHSVSKRHRGS